MNINPKKVLALLFFTIPGMVALAQDASQQMKQKFGVKAGLNFPSVSNFKSAGQAFEKGNGFMIGGYFASPSKRIGYRSELIFSRQGYDYRSSTQTGSVKLDYIVMPQLMTLNISRFLQLQAGGQLAILLSANVDSSANPSSVPNMEKAQDYFNRLNYGFAGGVEVSPVRNLSIGGRYNIFFNMLSHEQQYPVYIPNKKNIKNGLLQLYLGYSF